MSQFKRMGVAVVLVAALVAGVWAQAGQVQAADEKAKAKPADPLQTAKVALRGRHYNDAVAALDTVLSAKPKGAALDEAAYLRALALYYAGRHDDAAKAAGAVATTYKNSPWLRKARFLQAMAYVQKRNYRAAEEIYEAEANRLLSEKRKQKIAGVILSFADALATKPDPQDLGAPPPNYGKAYNLYRKALAMEIGRALRDEVMYKQARTIQEAGNAGQAVQDYRKYLAEFDPEWTGPVGSPSRLAGLKRENPKPTGKHPLQARYHLAEAQIKANDPRSARVNLEDLLALLGKQFADKQLPGPIAALQADTRWQVLRTYQLPNPAGAELEAAVTAAGKFLSAHKADPRAVVAAWWIARAYQAHGRSDQAIEAYEAFLADKPFALPKGPAATEKLDEFKKSPAALRDEWRKMASFLIGQIRFQQKKYTEAQQAWTTYINRYPNGPQWSACQRGIINAQFQVAVDAVADKKYDAARELFEAFLTKHPLDERARQILYTLGQMEYAQAKELEEGLTDLPAKAAGARRKEIREIYQRTIDRWERLVSKYPNTQESSLALYRIGMIYEEKLADLDKALEAYRRLTWGSYASRARSRVAVMTGKHLAMRTERTYRTNEPAKVHLTVRNIEKLTFKQYSLELEAYFRKTHAIGKINHLDIDLIQPDKTWEVKIDGYAKYKLIDQEVEIPLPKGKPGVCLVNVGEDDLEATTLVIRSDLDLIAKSSRREALVFVADRLKKAGAEGVDVLLSDGAKVFATGKTGKDGVFRGKFKELANSSSLRVFASRGGHVASNALSLQGLKSIQGLSARGYLYTDRPAYQPGQTVRLRGIIRDVKNGSYTAPKGDVYLVSVTDSQGRLIWQRPQELGEFGTFHTQLALDSRAPLGRYRLTARRKAEPHSTYSANFLVQRFKLEKMRLKLTTDQKVYFRGETAEVTIRAEYYWGQAVADKPVRYFLPDGRQFVQPTDAKGELKVSFDTTGLAPGRPLVFRASIEGENVQAAHVAYLAKLGFGASVKPSRPLALAGEPVDIEIKTTTPDGKPLGKDVTLTVLRRQVPKADPVLSQVPWLTSARPAAVSAEVTVQEKKVTTDAKTGKAVVALKLDKGGQYTLRVSGEDRFKQVVTAQAALRISDDEDETKLRLFADSDTLQVGRAAIVRLHSRLDAPLALVTLEGEEIIEHRVVPIHKGFNPVKIDVDHEHFPNFRLSVDVMDGRKHRAAAKGFVVERQLNVTVQPVKDTYAPGAKGKVEIRVTDQLGRPVRAELSLSVVDEALLAIFPDSTPEIRAFFQRGATRYAEFRAVSSCGFEYRAETVKVVKAIKEEHERLVRVAQQAQRLEELKLALPKPVMRGAPQSEAAGAGRRANALTDGKSLRQSLSYSLYSKNGLVAGRVATGGSAAADPGSTVHNLAAFAPGEKADKARDRGGAAAQPRREMPEAGWWTAAIVTGKDGKAVIDVPMPETTTQWRLISRGCTVETLVGQAKANVLTKKDFFLAIKTPPVLQEGDRVRLLARVHNLTDHEGPVELTLTVYGGDDLKAKLLEKPAKTKIKKHAQAEVLFDEIEIPLAAAVKFVVTAKCGKLRDAIETEMNVRPWGVELADHDGGVADGDAAVQLQLPSRKYASQWMVVSLGPDLKRSVIEMALGRRPRPIPAKGTAAMRCLPPGPIYRSHAGNDLLAVVAAMKYARSVGAPRVDQERLADRARTLIGTLVVTQGKDGGWSWTGQTKHGSDWSVTARTLWALCAARDEGLIVHASTIAKAVRYAKNQFSRFSANDNDAKALVLHALSTAGAAEFAHANRLHRERNTLSAPALAYTALAMVNLKRTEFAKEILEALDRWSKTTPVGGTTRRYWSKPGLYPWLSNDVEATALAMLAWMQVEPASPKVAEAARYLLGRRGAFGFVPAQAGGPAVAALAGYFAKGAFAEADYRLTVLVNGKELKTVASRGAAARVELAVPKAMLKDGKNLVEFRQAGRGRYAYAVTLRGFTSDLRNIKTFSYPRLTARYYRHATLEYRGKPISAGSTSPVKDIEIGQRIRVVLNYYNSHSYNGYLIVEEPLPAGMMLVEGSLKGNFTHHEVHDGKIVMYYTPGRGVYDVTYDLIGYATGNYRVLPTILRDALKPNLMRLGSAAALRVLKPGEKSDDPYHMNDNERYMLGQLYFNDGLYKQALTHLSYLFKNNHTYNEREVARMLLWIYTAEGFYDAKQIVAVFEVLRERYPTLEIPFDKILVVGKAYRDLGEFERAYLVFRATIDASFINDANVSAVLEDEGQFLGSIDYQEDLWREYPDTAQVSSAYFAISQALYRKAPQAYKLAEEAKRLARTKQAKERAAKPAKAPTKVDLLVETIRLLTEFLTLYPEHPLADDAAFSMANAYLDLKQFPTVIELCDVFKTHFVKSDFASGFQYMIALGHFWQRQYANALKAATVVADGKSKDRDFARYIVGQIHHAQGKPAEAIAWYRKVADKYPDAKQAIGYFEAKHIRLDEVNVVRPGKPVDVTLKYRNIKEAFCQVYRVDLMKLYLREKNLANITKVNLAGIAPLLEKKIVLGDGKDYVDKTKATTLQLKDEGAYLLICRGDDLFTSSLVLITPLKIEVQEDATSGRVRANVIDAVTSHYVPEVHVKAIGSADASFRSGETDLRGIFVADNLRGKATVIARQGDSRYAFYRGEKWLGAPKAKPAPRTPRQAQPAALDYQKNLRMQNTAVQELQFKEFDQLRRATQKGVQIQKAK